MNKLLLFLSILGGLYASTVFAADFSKLDTIKSFSFQVGTHTAFYDNIQKDSSGNTRKFDFAPTIGAGLLIPSEWGIHIMPELNWVLPQKAGSSQIIKNLFMFRFDAAYDVWEWLRLRLGTSLMWQNIHGRGGKETVDNGTSQSTFYYPDENRSALNNTFDLGVEGFIASKWSVRLQTYTYSLFDSERRQLSYTLFGTYYWDR